ncbi:MAG: S-methyl-5-thioribose-1-phosphate isomerase [Deltaproteobacteria bacterium]|nr:S-methyl-5-thioribose-1-phosphate isomerase [Deltaproteobacteria bacterium]
MIRTIEWRDDAVVMLDQRLLPTREVYNTYRTHDEVARAIKDMVIRGAPAIGVAAALGVALGMRQAKGNPERALERICAKLAATRPTAVNLAWALARMRRSFVANRSLPTEQLRKTLLDEALAIRSEDIEARRAMGRLGAELIPAGACVMSHCNAGALATAGYGTALGVIRAAREAGKGISVITNETRPFLQGARLTAWELVKEKIPATLSGDARSRAHLESPRRHRIERRSQGNCRGCRSRGVDPTGTSSARDDRHSQTRGSIKVGTDSARDHPVAGNGTLGGAARSRRCRMREHGRFPKPAIGRRKRAISMLAAGHCRWCAEGPDPARAETAPGHVSEIILCGTAWHSPETARKALRTAAGTPPRAVGPWVAAAPGSPGSQTRAQPSWSTSMSRRANFQPVGVRTKRSR